LVGVWLQKDSYRGHLSQPMTLHQYGYVNDNPTNLVDWYGYRVLDFLSSLFKHDEYNRDTAVEYALGHTESPGPKYNYYSWEERVCVSLVTEALSEGGYPLPLRRPVPWALRREWYWASSLEALLLMRGETQTTVENTSNCRHQVAGVEKGDVLFYYYEDNPSYNVYESTRILFWRVETSVDAADHAAMVTKVVDGVPYVIDEAAWGKGEERPYYETTLPIKEYHFIHISD
jgi:hypothetical protein